MKTTRTPFLLIACLCASFALVSINAFAKGAFPGPQEMLEQASDQLIASLEKNTDALKADPDLLLKIVEGILLPHVDFDYMARWVVGRNAWKKANHDQRLEFTEAFKDLLVRTYANVASEYGDESIIYYPIRGDIEGKRRVQVSSLITQAGRDPIDVVYRLTQGKSGEWKLYDIVIEGVSLLKGFQAQFEDRIRQDGLEALTNDIVEHNQDKEALEPSGDSNP